MKNIESKFNLGSVVATAGVADLMRRNPVFKAFCMESLIRHGQGDWGDICKGYKELNDEAVAIGERIMSVYCCPNDDASYMGRKIWIITERDRSSTTILFPNEY